MTTPSDDHSTPHFQFSERARRTVQQPISYLMAQAVNNPNVVSLAAGLVDYPSLPSSEVTDLCRELLGRDSSAAKIPLQYGTTQGLTPLRQRLLDHMAALDGLTPSDLGASVENVVLTTGSQQLLFLLTDALVDPGDIVITGWPSYFVYTGALQTLGADVRCVDIDADGMVPDALEQTLAEIDRAGDLGRVKILYVVDYHQNPTGITLAAERRPVLLDIVRRYSRDHRILLLEDAAYRELTFEGEPPPSIKRYDTTNQYVVLAHTFSKTFSPGLKIGYGLLPDDLVQPIVLQKGSHDFGSTNLSQHLIFAALETGAYQEHVQRLRSSYVKKRDTMLTALAESLRDLPEGQVSWTRPTGGLYVWLTLPESVNTDFEQPLFRTAMEHGVLYVPGSCCYPDDRTREVPRNSVRLSFGAATLEEIRLGVERLAEAVHVVLGAASA